VRIAVIGAGVVGLAVTYELATAGREVDCYEAGAPMAARSCGDTRIFRLAHDRPALVDWAREAKRGWQDWSRSAGVQLVGNQGTVVSGDIAPIATAMSDAGAPFEIVDAVPSLPAAQPSGPFLVDVRGGVIQAAATGTFLTGQIGTRIVPQTVTAIRITGGGAIVATEAGERSYDSVVVAAGAGAPELVRPLGVDLSTLMVHHARMTFPLRDPDARPPCWLDRSQRWRPGFTSYGQSAGPGSWAVGGHLPDEDTAWELGRDVAIERARQALTDYVTACLTACEPEVMGTIYCNVTAGLGGGLSSARVGPVLVVWGDNLFKLAPVIGRTLADAATSGGVPEVLATVAHDSRT
jgi:sarcosine oxidase